MNKVMAIILNYNSLDDTSKCLNYLQKQQGVDLKVCIVDNGSTEDKKEEIENLTNDQNTFVIFNQENKGYSSGNNKGLKKAIEENCDYALIINPDVEIRDADYVSKLAEVMSEDKTIAVAGTNIINADGKKQNPLREPYFIEELLWPVGFAKNKFGKELPFVKKNAKSGCCKKLSGCCFMIDLDFVQDIGFFDEGTFLYSEESILAAAVRDKGMIEYYCSDIIAYHMHIASEKGDKSDRMKIFYKSRRYFINNYGLYGKLGDKIVDKVLKFRQRRSN